MNSVKVTEGVIEGVIMKKSIVLCLVATLIVTGCGKKEKKAKTDDYHATLSETFHEYYASWGLSDIKLNYSFFFDVDRDGIDEFFYVSFETDGRGHIWRVFYLEDGKWTKFDLDDMLACALPWDFYYRDDTKQQPLLFVNDRESGPHAYTRNQDISKHIVVSGFDRQEFDNLRKQGILKRVTWYRYDGNGTRHIGELPEDGDSGEDDADEEEK
jgi:hypothetical protein